MFTVKMPLALVAASLVIPAAANAQHPGDFARTRVIVSTESNMSGPRKICLTPHARGYAVIASSLARRTCLSKQQWALRGFRVVES